MVAVVTMTRSKNSRNKQTTFCLWSDYVYNDRRYFQNDFCDGDDGKNGDFWNDVFQKNENENENDFCLWLLG